MPHCSGTTFEVCECAFECNSKLMLVLAGTGFFRKLKIELQKFKMYIFIYNVYIFKTYNLYH